MYKKIKCWFGLHEYHVGDGEVVHIVDDVFRVKITCRNCGAEQCGLIRVPIPQHDFNNNAPSDVELDRMYNEYMEDKKYAPD